MRRLAAFLLSLFLICPLGFTQDREPLPPLLVARTEPKTPEEEKKHFKLPPGFEAQLVACEPQINKPMNLNFDDRGRLWVTTSIEYPFPVPLDKPGRDRVVILEDFDENGRARKATNFAEGLNIPMGVLPLPTGWRAGSVSDRREDRDPAPVANAPGSPKGASAIVYSTPNLYRLTDTDGDGKADKREVLFGPFGYRDTHGNVNGLTWGFDGWVYACHGFANDSEIKGTDGHVVKMNSGNTFRFKPDGSRVEHWTFGQVNPFGMCFDPLGNLYTADCHSRPVTMLLRGGYYQSFGKPHDGLGFAPEICGHDHGSTGLCGIVYYAADHFPKEYHDTIFVGNCVTSRICHDKLEWTGSTPRCVLQPDFLVSDDPWFRPVDIKLGPDGALYVADFYNRIIGHYEVPLTHPGRDRERGRIWRIVYKGTDGKAKPATAPRKDWSTAKTEELIEDLGHANLTVRMLAMNQLVTRDDDKVREALVQLFLKPKGSLQRIHAMWAAYRLNDPRHYVKAAVDKDSLGLVHAAHILATSSSDIVPIDSWVFNQCLESTDPHIRRAIVEALGMRPQRENLETLLRLLEESSPADAQLRHSARIAIRNQLRHDEVWRNAQPIIRDRKNAATIADVAIAVPRSRAAQFFVAHMKSTSQTPEGQVRHVARYGSDKSREELLEFLKGNQQPAIVKAFHQGCQERGSGWNEDCQNWAKGVVKQLLASEKNEQITAAAELCGLLKLNEYAEPLTAFARKVAYPDNLRIAACNALTAIDAKANIGLIGGILTAGDEHFALQERCAQLLAAANLPEAREELAKALTTAPARLQNVIALHLAANPEGAEKLLQTIAAGKASPRLLQERGVQQRVTAARLPKGAERVAELTRNLAPVEQRLAELFKKRKEGYASATPQVGLGAKVYEKNCANCHQLAGKGAKVGPQLDGIGARGVDRLLEDMLDPSRNVDQAMRSQTILLKNGQLLTGLPLREEGQIIVLADAQGKEIRIAKGEIEQQKISPLSPMPANLIDQIPEDEFYHLLAFLLEQRSKQ